MQTEIFKLIKMPFELIKTNRAPEETYRRPKLSFKIEIVICNEEICPFQRIMSHVQNHVTDTIYPISLGILVNEGVNILK